MGIYIYSMRKPVKNVEVGNTREEIARLQFLIKCSDVEENAVAKRLVRACESRFDHLPKYVIFEDKWMNGVSVYRWLGNKPWAYDTPSTPMYKVGSLDLDRLRINFDPIVNLSLKWVSFGDSFMMCSELLKAFNEFKIDSKYDKKFNKGVTDYSDSDIFVMNENGEFSSFRNGRVSYYSCNLLPVWFRDWSVKMRTHMYDRDMTNEFEAMYS